MDTSNGKAEDNKQTVFEIGGTGPGQSSQTAAHLDTNKTVTYIDQPMLSAMEQMFSQPSIPVAQQQPVQQFHPQLKQYHPTTAATSTPQLYFN